MATAPRSRRIPGALWRCHASPDEGLARRRISRNSTCSHPDRRSGMSATNVLMAAIARRWQRPLKHVLALVEGATENTGVVRALIDNLLARGLDPTLPRLFIVDGAKALSKALRNTFGVAAAIQRCQVHKGRNIDRAPAPNICTRASRRRSVRPGTRTTQTRPSGSCATWSGVWRHGHRNRASRACIHGGCWRRSSPSSASSLPHELRRSARRCTNIVENALGTVRQVTLQRQTLRDTPRWRSDGPPPSACVGGPENLPSPQAYRQLPADPPKCSQGRHLRKAQAATVDHCGAPIMKVPA